jgi:hypothetical protein
MHVISFTLAALVASASMVMAAPAEANGAAAKWTCPNGWIFCGVRYPLKIITLLTSPPNSKITQTCNGTSCKVGGIN